HSCPHCHSAVPDTSAFCPNCEAPQIRFVPPERPLVPVMVAAGVAAPLVQPEATLRTQNPARVSSRHAAFRAAINGGVVGAVLSLVPMGGSFVFALPIAGFLSVLLYRRYNVGTEPTPGTGFRLGVGAGLAGFVIFMTVLTIATVGFHAQNELRDGMMQAVRQAHNRYSDPQSRVVFGAAFMCLLFVLLSGLGGAVSAALLRRKFPPH